jgi:hypothetical protein
VVSGYRQEWQSVEQSLGQLPYFIGTQNRLFLFVTVVLGLFCTYFPAIARIWLFALTK